ncbi:MAG: EH signature domain-containing protein [Desulfomicrobiaceae bacterium]
MTTGLRTLLQTWRLPRLLCQPEPLVPIHTQRAREEIERRLTTVEPKPLKRIEIEEVWRAIKRTMAQEQACTELTKRELNAVPWVVFARFDQHPPLAEDFNFISFFYKCISSRGGSKAIVATVAAFLQYYPIHSPTFKAWKTKVSSLLNLYSTPRCQRLKDCASKVGFFEDDGPVRLWQYIQENQRPVQEILDELWLTGPRARLGFVQAAFFEATASVRGALEQGALREAGLQRLFDFALIAPEGARAERVRPEPRFDSPDCRRELAESLLLPFAHGNRNPNLKPRIQEFLLRHLGDPRLDRRNLWRDVSEEARRIMLGWLVEETLEDFFRLLEYTAEGDAVARRHWRYRQAFWTAYLKAGVIREAWVVLGPGVDYQARRRLGLQQESYGQLHPGQNVQHNHAVLILRIGHLLITDWSHNGMYRVWNEGEPNARLAPKPYQRYYQRSQLVQNPDYYGRHYSSENGGWQEKLASYIYQQTGIKLLRSDYMPHD